MKNQYTFKKYNCEINIFYLNKVEDTISPTKIEYFLDSILFNLKPYINEDFYNNLRIDIWHTRREDIPKDEIGQKEFLGLTWASKRYIQLEILDFSSELLKDAYISNLLSHELGHYFQEYIGFNNSLLKDKWIQLRGIDEIKSTNQVELFAEDFRLLFGSPLAKDLKRGDYIQATEKTYLKDFMLLFKIFNDYYNEKNKQHWFYSIKQLDIKTSPFGIIFYEDYGFFEFLNNKWVYLRSDGIYYHIQNNWVKIKRLK